MHRTPILNALARYAHRHPDEDAVTARFAEFIRTERRCFERNCWAGHVTGSAWLVDGAGRHVLLTHHKKLGRWLQLGGHSDGDPDSLGVALREAVEESGLSVDPVWRDPFDLDIHPIPPRGTDPEHFHFDVRYALRVRASETFALSDESHELAWVPIADVKSVTDEASILRMTRKWLTASCSRGPTKAR